MHIAFKVDVSTIVVNFNLLTRSRRGWGSNGHLLKFSPDLISYGKNEFQLAILRLGVVRTNSFCVFLKSMIERLGVDYDNTIPTMVTLFQYPVDVVVNVTACMVMSTEMGKQ